MSDKKALYDAVEQGKKAADELDKKLNAAIENRRHRQQGLEVQSNRPA